MTRNQLRVLTAAITMACLAPANAAEALPDPDANPADMSKPVQVYILMGQSNMLGFGKPDALQTVAAEKYPYLVDDAGAWTVRNDVRNVFIMTSGNKVGGVKTNDWMTVSGRFGPEHGIGHHLGHVTDAPVMILKSCIGNRSLGWDLLPPGSEPYEHGGTTQPGYRGTPDDPKGNGEPVQGKWYAGCQYDGDIASARHVLENLDQFYPGAKGYQVKGFFWWQGDKDMRNPAHYERYERNLVNLIKALRKDFNAPDALFVTASLGQTKMGSPGGDGKILDAMKAVAESNDPELKGKVAFVYTHPLSRGGSSSGHYGGNPETYMNVGEAMGKAMVELLGKTGGAAKSPSAPPTRAGKGPAPAAMPEGIDPAAVAPALLPAVRALSLRQYANAGRIIDRLEQTADDAHKQHIATIRTFIDGQLDTALKQIDAFIADGNYYRAHRTIVEGNRSFRGMDRFDARAMELLKGFREPAQRMAIQKGTRFYQLIDNAQRVRNDRTVAMLADFAEMEADNVFGKAAAAAVTALTDDPNARLDGDALVAAAAGAGGGGGSEN